MFFVCCFLNLCLFSREPLEYWCSRKFCTGGPQHSLLIGPGGAMSTQHDKQQAPFSQEGKGVSQDAVKAKF